jgi:hypothetical protein
LQAGLDRLMGDLPVGRSYRPQEIELPRPDDIVRKELVQLSGPGLQLAGPRNVRSTALTGRRSCL